MGAGLVAFWVGFTGGREGASGHICPVPPPGAVDLSAHHHVVLQLETVGQGTELLTGRAFEAYLVEVRPGTPRISRNRINLIFGSAVLQTIAFPRHTQDRIGSGDRHR